MYVAQDRLLRPGRFVTRCRSDWCLAETRVGITIPALGSTPLRSPGIRRGLSDRLPLDRIKFRSGSLDIKKYKRWSEYGATVVPSEFPSDATFGVGPFRTLIRRGAARNVAAVDGKAPARRGAGFRLRRLNVTRFIESYKCK
jgi:hypothetical protein